MGAADERARELEVADEIAIGALAVAAIGVASGPATAWLTSRWARKSEVERWNRERGAEKERWTRERHAEGERWKREDSARRVERGEKAAGELLTVVDAARLQLVEHGPVKPMDFQPTYHEIRRLADLITDDGVRDRLYEVAEAVFYYHQALMVEEGLSRWNVGRTYADAAHSVIRAYLKGKPCPATPRLARLTALIAEGAAQILEEIDEDLPDPLGPNDG